MGGNVGDYFGIRKPFYTAFFLFCFSGLYAHFAMPYISPESLSDHKKDLGGGRSLAGFFEPLKVLAPQRIRLSSGQITKHRGVFFLCAGVFLGVVSFPSPLYPSETPRVQCTYLLADTQFFPFSS